MLLETRHARLGHSDCPHGLLEGGLDRRLLVVRAGCVGVLEHRLVLQNLIFLHLDHDGLDALRRLTILVNHVLARHGGGALRPRQALLRRAFVRRAIRSAPLARGDLRALRLSASIALVGGNPVSLQLAVECLAEGFV